jgi:hypothetical protein
MLHHDNKKSNGIGEQELFFTQNLNQKRESSDKYSKSYRNLSNLLFTTHIIL